MNLLDNIRTHLMELGIARDPREAGAAPPLWLNPQHGAVGPGDRKGAENDAAAVLSAYFAPGVPPGPYEEWQRRDGVDLWLRVSTPGRAKTIEKQVRDALDNRRGWTMGGLSVIESSIFRDLSPLGFDQGVWTFTTGYIFQLYD